MVGNTTTSYRVIPVGSNGKVLTASSTATAGVSWEPTAAGGGGVASSGVITVNAPAYWVSANAIAASSSQLVTTPGLPLQIDTNGKITLYGLSSTGTINSVLQVGTSSLIYTNFASSTGLTLTFSSNTITYAINTAASLNWTGFSQFSSASTTQLWSASTSFPGLGNAILVVSSTDKAIPYAGSTVCGANQFVTLFSATGTTTCATPTDNVGGGVASSGLPVANNAAFWSGPNAITGTSTFTFATGTAPRFNVIGEVSSTAVRAASGTIPTLNGNIQINGEASSTSLRSPSGTVSVLVDGQGNKYVTSTAAGATGSLTQTTCDFDPSTATLPDTAFADTGRATSTQSVWNFLAFDSATQESASWKCTIPSNLTITTTTLDMAWTTTSTTATSTPVTWQFGYKSANASSALSLTLTTSSVNAVYATTTANSVALVSSTLTTSGNFVSGQLLLFQIARQVANASDTLATDAQLLWARLRFW